jgi:hypothetical protein
MELWMSAEAWGDAATSLMKASGHIESIVNRALADKSYGEGVRQWAFITILLPPEMHEDYPEHFKYHRSGKSVEFRLRIDLETFRAADKSGQKRLICEALLRSLDMLDRKKIPDFDHRKLRAAFVEIARRHHWLAAKNK